MEEDKPRREHLPEEKEEGSRIRLLVLVQKPLGLSPGQRFRLEQWSPYLARAHGIDLVFDVYESPRLTQILYKPGHLLEKTKLCLQDTWQRRTVLQTSRVFDGVVVYREISILGPALYERLLAQAGVPLIYDFDDAIWSRKGYVTNNGLFAWLKFPKKTASICRLAKSVTVGNHYLADYAKQYATDVTVVPTTIELDAYPVQPPLPFEEPFTVVWSGSHTTLAHLRILCEALENLAQRRRVRLRIISDQFPDWKIHGVETEQVPWKSETEAHDLGQAHVGVMPLPDNPFSGGKCGLKALQYMAVARPAIVSPVGVNVDIIHPWENGVLASSHAEWVEALDRLAGDPALRARLGEVGRRTVEQDYTAQEGAMRFAAAVRRALGGCS